MPITPRVQTLRQASLDAVESLSSERAELLTAAYRQIHEPVSPPVRRALAFQYLMEHKTVYIGPGELIVGEKGPAPKATPTYPELCCHTLQDLDILDPREKISFKVSPQTAPGLRRDRHPLLGRPLDARADLPRDDRRVESRLRGRHLHRVHGAARPRPHRARRQDLPQGHARLHRRDRRRPGKARLPLTTRRPTRSRKSCKAMEICAGALIRFAERHAEKAEALAAG